MDKGRSNGGLPGQGKVLKGAFLDRRFPEEEGPNVGPSWTGDYLNGKVHLGGPAWIGDSLRRRVQMWDLPGQGIT